MRGGWFQFNPCADQIRASSDLFNICVLLICGGRELASDLVLPRWARDRQTDKTGRLERGTHQRGRNRMIDGASPSPSPSHVQLRPVGDGLHHLADLRDALHQPPLQAHLHGHGAGRAAAASALQLQAHHRPVDLHHAHVSAGGGT